jgi:hypothetical protein
VPLTAAHRAQKIKRMVDLTDTARGTVRLIFREVSRSGGATIDIFIERVKRFRQIQALERNSYRLGVSICDQITIGIVLLLTY